MHMDFFVIGITIFFKFLSRYIQMWKNFMPKLPEVLGGGDDDDENKDLLSRNCTSVMRPCIEYYGPSKWV